MKTSLLFLLSLQIGLAVFEELSKKFDVNVYGIVASRRRLDGRTCAASMRLVVKKFNEQSKYLPDYHINLLVDHSGLGSVGNARRFLTYIQDSQNKSKPVAPLVIGPVLDCQYISAVYRQFNMVQVSHGCVGPALTNNRKRYPNLYKITLPSDIQMRQIVHFVTKIGKWKQLSVISDLMNPFVLRSIDYFFQIATENGIEFPMIHGIPDKINNRLYDDLKSSDTRVVFVLTLQIPVIAQFLCEAHQNGIKGSKYVFITMGYFYFNPKMAKFPFCQTDVLIEQFERVFWASAFSVSVHDNQSTPLGYKTGQFNTDLDSELQGKRYVDNFHRHFCHDSTMAALLALDKGDIELRKKNMTILDFWAHPETVMKAVNSSMAATDFVGIRSGRMRYSDRLEFDSEPGYVGQFYNDKFHLLYRIEKHSNDSISHFMYKKPFWLTSDGNPPKDLSNVKHKFYEFPDVIFIATATAIVALIVAELSLLWVDFRKPPTEGFSNKYTDVMLVVGSVVLCVGAFSFQAFYFFSKFVGFCYSSVIFTLYGVAMVSSNLTSRLYSMRYFSTSTKGRLAAKRHQKLTSRRLHRHGSALSTTSSVVSNFKEEQKSTQSNSFVVMIAFSLLPTVILATWFLKDFFEVKKSTSPIGFSDVDDSYFDFTVEYCYSQYQYISLTIFVAYHSLCLIFNMTVLYEIRSVNYYSSTMATEASSVRNAVINLVASTILVVIILVLVDFNQTTLFTCTISVALVLTCALCTMTVLIPTTFRSTPK